MMASQDGFRIELGSWQEMAERARPLRVQVFVTEQGVPPALECDEFDAMAEHALALDTNGRTIGTGRLLPDGHIGRMAVLAEWRRRGVGSALLERLLQSAREQGLTRIELNAQIHAAPFYARFGFVPEGAEFLEAGIRHLAMSLSLHGKIDRAVDALRRLSALAQEEIAQEQSDRSWARRFVQIAATLVAAALVVAIVDPDLVRKLFRAITGIAH